MKPYTMTVKFSANRPMTMVEHGDMMRLAELIREMAGGDEISLDDVWLFDAETMPVTETRLVSGHYWPCINKGHPRSCRQCRDRHNAEAPGHSEE